MPLEVPRARCCALCSHQGLGRFEQKPGSSAAEGCAAGSSTDNLQAEHPWS